MALFQELLDTCVHTELLQKISVAIQLPYNRFKKSKLDINFHGRAQVSPQPHANCFRSQAHKDQLAI